MALPTNRQQIMRRAAARGHGVLFVETGGWLARHLWALLRGGGRGSLARRLTVGERVAPGVEVRRLLTFLPWSQRYGVLNRLNWRLGAAGIRRAARGLPAPRVVWIYDPRGVAAVGTLDEAFAVYDCVDDYPEQAGYSQRSRAFVTAVDEESARRARIVFATTRPLLERHLPHNPRTRLVPNVGDYEHFAPAASRALADEELRALPRPVLGFAGNLELSKVDFSVLAELAAAFPDGTLLIAGPARGPALAAIKELATRPNVRWVGPRPYEQLPRLVAAFDVGMIPYVTNDYTRSCFPLKLYEYLAAGKPVVATGLPELAGLEPAVTLAPDADAAVAAVRRALDDADTGVAERIALAARNTWDTRTSTLLDLVQSELEEP